MSKAGFDIHLGNRSSITQIINQTVTKFRATIFLCNDMFALLLLPSLCVLLFYIFQLFSKIIFYKTVLKYRNLGSVDQFGVVTHQHNKPPKKLLFLLSYT